MPFSGAPFKAQHVSHTVGGGVSYETAFRCMGLGARRRRGKQAAQPDEERAGRRSAEAILLIAGRPLSLARGAATRRLGRAKNSGKRNNQTKKLV